MQNVKDEDNQQDTSQQKSESKENQSPSLQGQDLSNYRSNKVIFLALLDAAMRYREATWREDLIMYEQELYKDMPSSLSQYKANYKVSRKCEPDGAAIRRFTRDMERKIKESINIASKDINSFNARNYKEVERTVKQMTPAAQLSFDNYATGFGVLMEEFVKANNTTHFLTICKLYNSGAMDKTLEILDKEEKPIEYPDPEKNEPVADPEASEEVKS